MLFTVPFCGGIKTIERARIIEGEIEYIEPPICHKDPLRNGIGILTYRDYGTDIIERLIDTDFKHAWIQKPSISQPWGFCRDVVVARK